MEIFISWHGPRSHAVAEALRNWLPQIVNAFEPWLSSADIDKGARWGSEISIKSCSKAPALARQQRLSVADPKLPTLFLLHR